MKGLSLFELLSEHRLLEKGIPLLACYQSITRSFALPYAKNCWQWHFLNLVWIIRYGPHQMLCLGLLSIRDLWAAVAVFRSIHQITSYCTVWTDGRAGHTVGRTYQDPTFHWTTCTCLPLTNRVLLVLGIQLNFEIWILVTGRDNTIHITCLCNVIISFHSLPQKWELQLVRFSVS
jgi:hypothetical protein